MTKTPPRQLEFPLLVNLNAKDHLHRKPVASQKGQHASVSPAIDSTSLKATAEDLTIYRSISEGFLKKFN